jgi:REP element-mobilizing transposase RayT
MPRKAREKYPGAIFHIMCRSISELMLFRDNEDKNYYLRLLKRYKEKYKCSIYAYCIMNNHLHLHLDPKGFDVSKFMHSTNTAYVLQLVLLRAFIIIACQIIVIPPKSYLPASQVLFVKGMPLIPEYCFLRI